MDDINALNKQLNDFCRSTYTNPLTKSQISIHFFDEDGFYITHHTGQECDWDDHMKLSDLVAYLAKFGFSRKGKTKHGLG